MFNRLIIFLFSLLFVCQLSARDVWSFNSDWYFKKGPFPEDVMKSTIVWDKTWEKVTIPHTWNAQDMQTKSKDFYAGICYYKKNYIFPESMKRKRLFLKFEGVGSCSEVYVNGKLMTTHKGGYSAFSCEIGSAVNFGKDNEIVVKADNSSRPDVIPVNHTLFGVYGGIYRPVWLVATDSCNIAVTDCASSGLYISQKNVSKSHADIHVKVKLDNATLYPEELILKNEIYTQNGKLVKTNEQRLTLTPQGTQVYENEFTLNHPHLWNGREDPYLYKVACKLMKDGVVIDEVIQPLGIRKFEIKAGQGFYLNGNKYPMYGVTRHQDWWGKGSALTNKEHDFDLAQIMDIGATTIRLAHYQQSEYFYSRCDSLGLIVWAEIPFVNRVTGQETENAQSQLRELIRQNFNHPSIYVWGLHNEVYYPLEYTASLTQKLHDLAKTEDPDRYTASVNGYGIAEHPVNFNADIQGMNRYYGWYENKISDIKPWIEGLEKKYPAQKLILSEYGADANINQQTELLGDAIDWTKPFYPETFQTKLHEYQWAIISKHPYILASYLWNMFDFATPEASRGGMIARNMKGMMTFDRKVKKDSYFFYKANWSKDPVLYLTGRRNNERLKKETTVTVYSNIGRPKVFLNGEELTDIVQGYTPIHYIVRKVFLRTGKNVIKTVVTYKGKTYTDEMEWNYSGQDKGSAIEDFENKETHVGL